MSPYSDHPIYLLRITLLISAALGIIMSLIAILAGSFYSSGQAYSIGAFILLFSGLLALYDLVSYRLKKATDPDHNPPWPLRRFIYADLAFALVLQLTAWILWGTSSWSYNPSGLFEAYAALAHHPRPLLLERIPRPQKAAWLCKLPLLPCSVCGATDQGGPASETPTEAERDRAAELRARVYDLTPDDSSDSQILIQTDFDSSYGAIGQDCAVPTLSAKPAKSKRGKTKVPFVDAL